MATGRKVVAPGQLIASDWGNTTWDQTVQQFASAADRSTQFPAPKAGAVVWLDDVMRLELYTGAAWVEFTGANRAYIATISSVTVPLNGTLGWTSGVIIPAANYPRLALVSFSCLIRAVTSGPDSVSDVRIRRDGADISGGLGRDASTTVAGVWTDSIAAGAAPQYQGVLTAQGAGSVTNEGDPRFSWLQINTTPGVRI